MKVDDLVFRREDVYCPSLDARHSKTKLEFPNNVI